MQMREWELQQAQQSRRGSVGSVTTIAAVATTTEIANEPPPTPPPLPPVPPQPQQRRRNRCPCGECCVDRGFNTPGEFSFHAKAAVAVGAATTAITTTDHPRQILPPSTPPTPPPTAAAEIAMIILNLADVAIAAVSMQSYYFLGERKCFGRGRAEELPERAAAGVRVRALGHYSRGSGIVKDGGERKCDHRGRRQA